MPSGPTRPAPWQLGSTGVPFFVVDGRLGIPGAQPPDVLLRLLTRVWDSREETATTGPS